MLKVHLLPTCTQYDIVPPHLPLIFRLEIDRLNDPMDCQDVNDDENGLTCLHVLLSHSFGARIGQIVYQCITIDRQHYFQWASFQYLEQHIYSRFGPRYHY